MKNLLERLKNVGTIITLASLIVLLLTQTGAIDVDSEQVMNVVYTVCSIGVVLGVLNNPETSGIDLPGVNYPIFKQPHLSDVEEEAETKESLKKEQGIEE